jgi:ABC-type sugar transport system permease subunit
VQSAINLFVVKSFWQRNKFKREFTGWLFAAPLLIYFVMWVVLPTIACIVMTFSSWNGIEPISRARFIGLDNLIELSNDEKFFGAFKNTIVYALIVLTSRIVIGLLLALILNSVTRFVGFLRATYYLPVMLPATAMSLLWGHMYQPRYGLFNAILVFWGVKPMGWLMDGELALYCVAVMDIWKFMGWNIVVFLAGLKSIPAEMYDAAKVDGANAWQLFWKITLPLLKPTLLFVLVIATLQGLQVFDPIFILTRGGPANHTNVVVYEMYKNAFDYSRLSYASGMAVTLFIVIFGLTLIQRRILREGGVRSYYD